MIIYSNLFIWGSKFLTFITLCQFLKSFIMSILRKLEVTIEFNENLVILGMWLFINRMVNVAKTFTDVLSRNWPLINRPALIACNAMNWPGGDALSFSYRFHHWLMLYTLGQYIVNVQSSTTSEGFSTIFIFGICLKHYFLQINVVKFANFMLWRITLNQIQQTGHKAVVAGRTHPSPPPPDPWRPKSSQFSQIFD